MDKKAGAFKNRIVLKKGLEQVAIVLADIVSFYVESKMIVALIQDGTKYTCEQSLANVFADLDPDVFFRASRSHIINGYYLKSFKILKDSRILVEFSIRNRPFTVTVSQKRIINFKKWVYTL